MLVDYPVRSSAIFALGELKSEKLDNDKIEIGVHLMDPDLSPTVLPPTSNADSAPCMNRHWDKDNQMRTGTVECTWYGSRHDHWCTSGPMGQLHSCISRRGKNVLRRKITNGVLA